MRSTRPDRERLPRGRHGLAAAAVAENQRSRLLAAAADVFYDNGYLGTTSKRIATSAGVSSSAFYRHFEDVSDCLLAAFDVAADALLRALVGHRQPARDRRRPARLDAEALVAFARAEPQLAQLLGVELAAAEREIAARRRQLFNRLASACRDRAQGGAPARTSSIGQQLIAAAVALSSVPGEGQPPVGPDLAAQLGVLLDLAAERPW